MSYRPPPRFQRWRDGWRSGENVMVVVGSVGGGAAGERRGREQRAGISCAPHVWGAVRRSRTEGVVSARRWVRVRCSRSRWVHPLRPRYARPLPHGVGRIRLGGSSARATPCGHQCGRLYGWLCGCPRLRRPASRSRFVRAVPEARPSAPPPRSGHASATPHRQARVRSVPATRSTPRREVRAPDGG